MNRQNGFFIFLWKNKIINIVLNIIMFTLIVIIVFFVLEKKYTANVSLLPTSISPFSGVQSQFSTIAKMLGIGEIGLGMLSQDIYKEILISRDLLRKLLLKKYKYNCEGKYIDTTLIDFLKIKGKNELEIWEKAFKKMRRDIIFVEIDPDNNVLYLSVTLKDPFIAYQVANESVKLLEEIVKNKLYKEYVEMYKYLANRISLYSDSILVTENKFKHFLEQARDLNEPENIIKQLRFKRELEIKNNVFAELKKQEEILNLQKMFYLQPVKVLDYAEVPYRKSRPKRLLLTISLYVIFSFLQLAGNYSIYILKNLKKKLEMINI